MSGALRRAGLAIAVIAGLAHGVPAARAQEAAPRKLDLSVELGAGAGLGSATHDGAHGWIDGTPRVTTQSVALRAGRVSFGVHFGQATTDTTFTADPANGGRLLIALRPVNRITESITSQTLLFTARVSLFKSPRTLNPYISGAIGNARLRDRVVGDTAGTQITSVVGRRASALGMGLETRGWRVPRAGGLTARAYAEGLYWTRAASGEGPRLGVFYTSPYSPVNNYYQARDHYLYGLDVPPGKWTYLAFTVGLRLQYDL